MLELTEVRILAVMMILGFRDTDVLRVRFIGQGQRERLGEPERAQSEPCQLLKLRFTQLVFSRDVSVFWVTNMTLCSVNFQNHSQDFS